MLPFNYLVSFKASHRKASLICSAEKTALSKEDEYISQGTFKREQSRSGLKRMSFSHKLVFFS